MLELQILVRPRKSWSKRRSFSEEVKGWCHPFFPFGGKKVEKLEKFKNGEKVAYGSILCKISIMVSVTLKIISSSSYNFTNGVYVQIKDSVKRVTERKSKYTHINQYNLVGIPPHLTISWPQIAWFGYICIVVYNNFWKMLENPFFKGYKQRNLQRIYPTNLS